jgi:predicted Zn-dependent protease with MMP-like domain
MFWLIAILVASVGIPLWVRRNSADEPVVTEELAWKKKDLDVADTEPEQIVDPVTLRYSEQEFQELVAKALDEIPEEFDKEWENVAVIVSTGSVSDIDKKKMGVPEEHLVFGTYSGVDRTKGHWAQGSRHIVTIYQPALERKCGADKEYLEREIRRTVLHELAHHLGMPHSRMREIGL